MLKPIEPLVGWFNIGHTPFYMMQTRDKSRKRIECISSSLKGQSHHTEGSPNTGGGSACKEDQISANMLKLCILP